MICKRTYLKSLRNIKKHQKFKHIKKLKIPINFTWFHYAPTPKYKPPTVKRRTYLAGEHHDYLLPDGVHFEDNQRLDNKIVYDNHRHKKGLDAIGNRTTTTSHETTSRETTDRQRLLRSMPQYPTMRLPWKHYHVQLDARSHRNCFDDIEWG